jgi:hypothetical protein
MEKDITITRFLAEQVIFNSSKTNPSYNHKMEKHLDRCHLPAAETDEELKDILANAIDLVIEGLLFLI